MDQLYAAEDEDDSDDDDLEETMVELQQLALARQ